MKDKMSKSVDANAANYLIIVLSNLLPS